MHYFQIWKLMLMIGEFTIDASNKLHVSTQAHRINYTSLDLDRVNGDINSRFHQNRLIKLPPSARARTPCKINSAFEVSIILRNSNKAQKVRSDYKK